MEEIMVSLSTIAFIAYLVCLYLFAGIIMTAVYYAVENNAAPTLAFIGTVLLWPIAFLLLMIKCIIEIKNEYICKERET